MICRWCGNDLGEKRCGHFCNATHKRAYKRRKQELPEPKECPNPDKRTWDYRGDVARFAASQNLSFYLCECNSYHLTSQKVKQVDANTVNQLRNRYYKGK